MTIKTLNRAQKCANSFWLYNGRAMFNLWRNQRATQIDGWVAFCTPRGNCISEHHAAGTPQSTCRFIVSACLDFSQYLEELTRIDFIDRTISDRFEGEFKKPARFGQCR